MRRYQSRDTYKGLRDQVEAKLQQGQTTVAELSHQLGVGQSVVRRRLLDLLDAGRAHNVDVPARGGMGVAHVWLPGPAPKMKLEERARIREKHAVAPSRGAVSIPSQVTTRVYPGVHRRDPLVAALFGQCGGKP